MKTKLTAEITGISEDLIKRFSVILEVITCGAAIDPKQFGIYSYNITKMFLDLYGWYYMPVTVQLFFYMAKKLFLQQCFLLV